MGKTALILVDLQNDFCPGGALAVAEGDETITLANRLIPHYDLVVATQDWHPADHGSFASNNAGKQPGEMGELGGQPQVMWPNHCVQGTSGAAFHPELDAGEIHQVFQKGLDPTVDSYSGFFDNGQRNPSGLGDFLKAEEITDVHVIGLATDYCVKFTALDAKALGFATTVITEGCRGVELAPGDVDRALDALRAAGVVVVETAGEAFDTMG